MVGLLLDLGPAAATVDSHQGALGQGEVADGIEANPRYMEASVDGEETAVLPFYKQATRVVAHV